MSCEGERVSTEEITQDRLKGWTEELAVVHATPFLLVAIGHDERSGEIHVCVPIGANDDETAAILISVIMKLKGWK